MLTVEYIFPAVAVAGDIGSTAAGDKLSLLHILTGDMLRTLLPSLLLLATLTEAAHYLVWLPMCSK